MFLSLNNNFKIWFKKKTNIDVMNMCNYNLLIFAENFLDFIFLYIEIIDIAWKILKIN